VTTVTSGNTVFITTVGNTISTCTNTITITTTVGQSPPYSAPLPRSCYSFVSSQTTYFGLTEWQVLVIAIVVVLALYLILTKKK
jgi:hypothetical protein